IVVPESDGPESQREPEDQPDKEIAQIGPHQCGDHDAEVNQDSPHRRRARLALVGLRAVLPNVLPNLELLQPLDDPRTEHQREDKRRHACISGPKGDVPEEVKEVVFGVKPKVEVIKHALSAVCCPSSFANLIKNPRAESSCLTGSRYKDPPTSPPRRIVALRSPSLTSRRAIPSPVPHR